MADIIIWIIVGMFIGWNLPQPFWAKWLQNKVKGWISKEDGI